MVSVGLIGFGYWGPNLARNFQDSPQFELSSICDLNDSARERAHHRYPKTNIVNSINEITKDTSIELIAIATPVASHFEIAYACLNAGKHILVEKPFTHNSDSAKILIDLALSKNLIIMVDHTYLFTGSVKMIKQRIDNNELGKINYYDSMRANLGLFQSDVNVLWDLAPHDLSILSHIMPEDPIALAVHGAAHHGQEQVDIAFMTIYYPGGCIAHLNVNWLSPVKVRRTMIGGERQMLVWDDVLADEKIKIYAKGIDIQTTDDIHRALVSYRSGDVSAPLIDQREALGVELDYLHKCLTTQQQPSNDGISGLNVVRLLELGNQSLRNNGNIVEL